MKLFLFLALLLGLSYSQDTIPDITIGYGMGSAYSGVGFNAEYEIYTNINFVAGIGLMYTDDDQKYAYLSGLSFYSDNKNERYRTRVSFLYAKSLRYMAAGDGFVDPLTHIISLDIGSRWLVGKNKNFGIDFSLRFSIYNSDGKKKNDFEQVVLELFKLSPSLGFRLSL